MIEKAFLIGLPPWPIAALQRYDFALNNTTKKKAHALRT